MTCLINLALFISDWWIPGVVFLSTISKSVVHSLLQYPTLVKMYAVTSVCSALVDTPAPAHKVPLQWNLILIFVMQVKKLKKTLSLSEFLHLCCLFYCISFCILGWLHQVCLAAPVSFCEMCWSYCYCVFCVCLASAPAAIEPPVSMPLACRCMNGGTCYTDEGGLPKCKWVQLYCGWHLHQWLILLQSFPNYFQMQALFSRFVPYVPLNFLQMSIWLCGQLLWDGKVKGRSSRNRYCNRSLI